MLFTVYRMQGARVHEKWYYLRGHDSSPQGVKRRVDCPFVTKQLYRLSHNINGILVVGHQDVPNAASIIRWIVKASQGSKTYQ